MTPFSGDIGFWLGPIWSYGENVVKISCTPTKKKSALFLLIEAIQHAQLL